MQKYIRLRRLTPSESDVFGLALMTTKTKPPAIDKYELLTSKLITLMEQGKKPWVKSWHGNPCQNAITGHIYKGANPLLCTIDMLINDWEHPYFVGFHQAKSMNWIVRGSSTWLVWGGSCAKENKETGEKEFRKGGGWHNVFNIALMDDSKSDTKIVDWLAKKKQAQSINADKPIVTIEEFIKAQRSQLKHMGNQPCYIPSEDTILMPEFEHFTSANEYYSTLAHEHVHWTGHDKRLAREGGKFGTPKYACEELVTE
jgi:antirestriction protein ArdC